MRLAKGKPMRRFTLDTSCVIAAVSGGPAASDEQLVELARSGQIEIVTSAVEVDQRRASNERCRAALQWLGRALILQVPGPFRFDMSNPSGLDVFTEDDIPAVDEAISKIVQPKEMTPANAPTKRMQDVDSERCRPHRHHRRSTCPFGDLQR